MRDRPADITERQLRRALAAGWRLRAADVRYAAVGGGSYHWAVRDDQGQRWFVTVDDLDAKGWLGQARPAVFAGLRTAMDTAVALRHEAGLRFVVPPVPARDGATIRPLGSRYAVAVFPFLRGAAGRFGERGSPAARARLVEMLAALHTVPAAAVRAPRSELRLPRRDDLDAALDELDRPWHGGPFAEPARALLSAAAGPLRQRLRTLDRWAGELTGAAGHVVTHGEPHPGNLIRVGSRLLLVDWDTVGLARPERDLWMVAGGNGEGLRRYATITGRPVDRAALALYRLRWALDDTSMFARQLRAPHVRSADTEHAWQALRLTVAGLTAGMRPR